jgi:tight adherence protein B
MPPLVTGLLLGIGLFCIWWSFWPPEERPSSGGARRRTWLDHLADDLVQAGHAAIGPNALLTTCALAALLVFVLFYGLVSVASIALAFALIAAYGPIALVKSRARRRRAQLRDLWPDAVDNITSGVRAGMALPESLAQLAIRGPVPLRPAFARFAEDYRVSGRFNDSLDNLKANLSDPVGDRLVEALRMAREVGGSDLGRLLRTLSSFLRDDAHARAELETRQSWTVNAARLAVAAPWIILALMCTRPEAVQSYASATGSMVLLAGGGCTLIAYRLMVRIARLPEEDRVLG